MLANYQRQITASILRCGFFKLSLLKPNAPILHSQFHKNGLPGFQAPKERADSHSKAAHQKLNTLQQELQSLRKALQQTSNSQKLQKYVLVSEQLSKLVGTLPDRNDYICRIIGWYNMVDFYKELVSKLLSSEQGELRLLIACLEWMRFRWKNDYGLMDQDLILGQQIKLFYKRLRSTSLTLTQLRSLEDILIGPVLYEKREFYYHYVAKYMRIKLSLAKSGELQELIWLLQAYTKSMNDDQSAVSLLQNYLLQHKCQLSSLSIQRLKRIYELRGQINQEVYSVIIRPYMFKHEMGTLAKVVENIAFAVLSECEDQALLRTLYGLIDTLQSRQRIESSRHLYLLHLYTHYLMIKGYRIRLNQNMQRSILQFCRQRTQGRTSVGSIALAQLQQAQPAPGYVSPCLAQASAVVRQFERSKSSEFQEKFMRKLAEMSLDRHQVHYKPVFCCFQLDFCLRDKTTSQLLNIEVEGIQYVFRSGKRIRDQQIRDQIIRHYGIKVHRVDFNFIINKHYSDLEDFLARAFKKPAS